MFRNSQRQKMFNFFGTKPKYFAFCLSLFAILSPSTSYAVDEQQCLGLLNPKPLPPLVDKAAEEYSFHYANVVSIYSSMYSVMDEHCSEALGDELSVKKDAVIGHLLLSFPSNEMMKNDGFRECLLSHFHTKGVSSNPSIVMIEKSLNQLIPYFEKRIAVFKATALKTNEKYTDYQICKGSFLLRSLVDGSPTPLGEKIEGVEKQSKVGMDSSNLIINSFCSESQC